MLLRARKHKILEFEGEILFQGRDDHVKITLLMKNEDIRMMLKEKMKETNKAIKETMEILEPHRDSESD